MTDNEIKKALECCAVVDNDSMNGRCDDECPFRETREHCHNLDSLILDLINRLQAENEEKDRAFDQLIEVARLWKEKYNNAKAENERLKKANESFADMGKMFSEIKAEAYKEFAERLKECAFTVNQFEEVLYKEDIDNLLKEIVPNYNEPTIKPALIKQGQAILKLIKEAPTADVVEVVRCRECKYLYCLSAIDRRFYCKHHPQGLSGINIVEDNPFCSYGERKED